MYADPKDCTLKKSHSFLEVASKSEEFRRILNKNRAQNIGENQTTILRNAVDQFYNLHEDNLSDILGKENLDTLRRLERKHSYIDHIILTQEFGQEKDCSHFEYRTTFGSGGLIGFVNEFCKNGKMKTGDQLCLAREYLNEPEFGQLEKVDLYLYEGDGKYKHCYQAYYPLKDERSSTSEIIGITKSMQAKNNQNIKSETREL